MQPQGGNDINTENPRNTYALAPSAPPLRLAFPSSSISSLPMTSPISSSSSSGPRRAALNLCTHAMSLGDQYPRSEDSDLTCSQKKWRWDEDENLRTTTRPVVHLGYWTSLASPWMIMRSSSGSRAARGFQQKWRRSVNKLRFSGDRACNGRRSER